MEGLPKHNLTQTVVLGHRSELKCGQLNWLCTLHIASQEVMYHMASPSSRRLVWKHDHMVKTNDHVTITTYLSIATI